MSINTPPITEWKHLSGNIGLPSNMNFSFGSEISEFFDVLTFNKFRYVIFKVDSTYYVIKQYLNSKYDKTETSSYKWLEDWTKQLNSSIDEAKAYVMTDIFDTVNDIDSIKTEHNMRVRTCEHYRHEVEKERDKLLETKHVANKLADFLKRIQYHVDLGPSKEYELSMLIHEYDKTTNSH